MNRFYPVVTGRSAYGQLDVVVARLRSDETAKKIMAAYSRHRELILPREGLALRVRANGEWALAFWGSNAPNHCANVRASYCAIPGIEVIGSVDFARQWFAREGAQRTMRILYCAKPHARPIWNVAGAIRVTVKVCSDGAYSRTIACSPHRRMSGKVKTYLEEAEAHGTVSAPEGGYLASTPEVLGAQLAHYCVDALSVGGAKDRAAHFRVK